MVSQILPDLLLGDGFDACNTTVRDELTMSGLIVNMAGGKLHDTKIEQIVYTIADLGPWSDQEAMFEIFGKSVPIIKEALSYKRKVLVYCAQGMQRSCSVVAAYLMQELEMPFLTAVQFVVGNRKNAFDEGEKINFQGALLKWEERLRNRQIHVSDL